MQHSNASQTPHGRSHRVTGAMTVVVGAILAVGGLAASPSLAYTGPDKLVSTSASNEASYWGAGCTKLDEPGGHSWEADADYSTVVLKAAQVDFVFYDVVKGDELEVDQNAISHFIFCPPTTSTTTTTTTSTTTTSSSIPEETTTTTEVGQAGPTTTTVPDEPTAAEVVGQAGPTTTPASGAGGTITVATELPQTGSEENAAMLVLGGLLVMVGAVLLLTARRPVTI